MGVDQNTSFSDREMTPEESVQSKYSLSVNYIISGNKYSRHYVMKTLCLLLTGKAKQSGERSFFEGHITTLTDTFFPCRVSLPNRKDDLKFLPFFSVPKLCKACKAQSLLPYSTETRLFQPPAWRGMSSITCVILSGRPDLKRN